MIPQIVSRMNINNLQLLTPTIFFRVSKKYINDQIDFILSLRHRRARIIPMGFNKKAVTLIGPVYRAIVP